jgi:hypothetical protein
MTARQDPIREVLGPLDGGRIPGGCEECDAYQVPECLANRVWVIRVHHDDGCPLVEDTRSIRPGGAV